MRTFIAGKGGGDVLYQKYAQCVRAEIPGNQPMVTQFYMGFPIRKELANCRIRKGWLAKFGREQEGEGGSKGRGKETLGLVYVTVAQHTLYYIVMLLYQSPPPSIPPYFLMYQQEGDLVLPRPLVYHIWRRCSKNTQWTPTWLDAKAQHPTQHYQRLNGEMVCFIAGRFKI